MRRNGALVGIPGALGGGRRGTGGRVMLKAFLRRNDRCWGVLPRLGSAFPSNLVLDPVQSKRSLGFASCWVVSGWRRSRRCLRSQGASVHSNRSLVSPSRLRSLRSLSGTQLKGSAGCSVHSLSPKRWSLERLSVFSSEPRARRALTRLPANPVGVRVEGSSMSCQIARSIRARRGFLSTFEF